MVTVLKVKKQLNIRRLEEQLSYSKGVLGKALSFVKTFLIDYGVDSLEEVSVNTLLEYRKYVKSCLLKINQKKYYQNLLEQVLFSYLNSQNPDLYEYAKQIIHVDPIRNKTVGFLLLHDIVSFEEINYEMRCIYKEYLTQTVSSKIYEHLKAMDVLKLDSIRVCNEVNTSFLKPVLKYENKKVFLLYHPSYELAKTFYYVQDKEDLVFDFSISTSIVLKSQIHKMLNNVLETETNWKLRRERFLIPLNLFYHFCIEHGISDIEQITEKQIKSFRESIDGNVGTKTDDYMQIVDNVRKFLFLHANNTNWRANAWFLERFEFKDDRMNPSREVKKIEFGEIEDSRNRELLKIFMKYQMAVSSKCSIQTVRCHFYSIHSFLRYLDERKLPVISVSTYDMERYFDYLDDKGIQSETFNHTIKALAKFFGYLVSQKEINESPVKFEYYYKKTFVKHNNRSVSENKQMEILNILKDIPEIHRLMFLNLCCLGVRINEVCCIKGNAYYWDGKDAWIKIKQQKMKNEKYVPIPKVLYELMTNYIEKNCISPDEYVFKSKSGGAYSASTFSTLFKQELKDMGVEDYEFRSHDFRHSVATLLYKNCGYIETVRDYLGHNDSDMTKQYIDYMPQIINSANEQFFISKNEVLTKGIKGQ